MEVVLNSPPNRNITSLEANQQEGLMTQIIATMGTPVFWSWVLYAVSLVLIPAIAHSMRKTKKDTSAGEAFVVALFILPICGFIFWVFGLVSEFLLLPFQSVFEMF